MARTVHVRLTGNSEQLLKDLEKEGLNERDVISKALGLLDLAYRSERVALLEQSPDGTFNDKVESLLVIGGLDKQRALREKIEAAEEASELPSATRSGEARAEPDWQAAEEGPLPQTTVKRTTN